MSTTERAATQWQPAKYLAFEKLRLRPALDLLDRIPQLPGETSSGGIRIVDLGAGAGNMASAFLRRWPQAHVTFTDSSADMLARARSDHAALPQTANFSYVEATFDDFSPDEPVDLIFSNAALQWVSAEAHETLLPRLASFLKPGGVLAFQIPDTRANPGCQAIVEAARQLGWEREVADVRWVTLEKSTGFYYELLTSCGLAPQDIWTTTYTQLMDGENPVADFLASTALGPYLEALGGRASPRGQQLEAAYRELVARAYTKQRDGRTLFDMMRVFVVATKTTPQ